MLLFLLMPHIACGPSPEKLFEQSIQTESRDERKKLREELLNKYPNHPYGLFAKAYLLGSNGEKDKSLEQLDLYSQVIKSKPELSFAYVNRGIARENLKLQADALGDYTKAIELNPNLGHAYLRRGMLRSKMKEYGSAVVDLGMAINLKPKDPAAYLARGNLYYKEKKYADALGDFNIVLEILPDSAQARFERGAVKYALKDYQGAKEDYARIQDSQENYKAAAELNIGLILKEQSAPRTEYCLHFGNAYQRDPKLASQYYQGHCS